MKKEIKIEPNTVVSRSKEIVASDMDGETVMMSIANGKYYGLDAVGSRIWELIEEPVAVSRLCGRLMQEFEVEEAQCQADVIEFLSELAADGLIARVE